MTMFQRLCSSLLLLPVLLHAQDMEKPVQVPATFEEQLSISSDLMALVNESALEPRSVGSYIVKVYAVDNPELPFDRFIAGLVRPRDGMLEAIKTVDLNHDGDKELVVIIRSAGSGSFLSADAFDISREELSLMAEVTELASDANPISALTEKLRAQDQ